MLICFIIQQCYNESWYKRTHFACPKQLIVTEFDCSFLRPVEFYPEQIQLIGLALRQPPDFRLARVHRRPRSGSGCVDSDGMRLQPVRGERCGLVASLVS